MDWTSEQERALAEVGAWLAEPRSTRRPVYRLFGYAGTGKTTLARHLASTCRGQVLFAAYTGKAALVMSRAGCTGATTIHSLIYTPFEAGGARERIDAIRVSLKEVDDPEQRAHLEKELRELLDTVSSPTKPKPSFILREESPLRQAELLVVDECSMVDEDMARDLMSFRVPILVLGDPAQLPPVKGEGFFTSVRPDVMLTNVQRQAKDNPIIAMATLVRENGSLPVGEYGSSFVRFGRPSPEEILDFDQVLAGFNKTRTAMNGWMRRKMGRETPIPVRGDRLICLRNDKQTGLLNGGMWETIEDAEDEGDRFVNLGTIRSLDTGYELAEVVAHRHILVGEEKRLAYWEWRDAQEFDYAYAITVHKSQGSQWPDVCLFDEWFMRDTRREWLYTAITRAQSSVSVYRRDGR